MPVAWLGLAAATLGVAAAVLAGALLRSFYHGATATWVVSVVLVMLALTPLLPWFRALAFNSQRGRHLADDDLVAARRAGADGRDYAYRSLGYAGAVLITTAVVIFAYVNGGGVAETFLRVKQFFSVSDVQEYFWSDFFNGLWVNIYVSVIVMILVLIFGLLIAVMRMLPGKAGQPLRLIATAYTDVFRGIPAIVTIVIVTYGMSQTGLPVIGDLPAVAYGIIALSMCYSAYVAEVYRAGIDSIHPSQTAAARSLGLSQGMTLRTVVIPQAVRRVVPPLLNDFISIQKDTALLSVISVPEVFYMMKQFQGQTYNFVPVLLAAAAFVLLTIPQARYCDILLNKQRKKLAGGA